MPNEKFYDLTKEDSARLNQQIFERGDWIGLVCQNTISGCIVKHVLDHGKLLVTYKDLEPFMVDANMCFLMAEAQEEFDTDSDA